MSSKPQMWEICHVFMPCENYGSEHCLISRSTHFLNRNVSMLMQIRSRWGISFIINLYTVLPSSGLCTTKSILQYSPWYMHTYVVVIWSLSEFTWCTPRILQDCFTGMGMLRSYRCCWSSPDGYGLINHYLTATKHIKFYCMHISGYIL